MIGRILQAKKKKLYFRYFNAQGRWDQEPIVVKYRKITQLNVNDRYTDIFSKYLRYR
ncbi:MAG: hypothetical protein AAFW73_12960 [Bacteroidota bacterium]